MGKTQDVRILQLVAKKAMSMEKELTSWAQSELLLGLGRRIHVTIEIQEEEVVDVEVLIKKKIFDGLPTENDWQEVFALPWNDRHITRLSIPTERISQILHELRKGGNESHKELKTRRDLLPFNNFFKTHGDVYRLMWTETGYVLRTAK